MHDAWYGDDRDPPLVRRFDQCCWWAQRFVPVPRSNYAGKQGAKGQAGTLATITHYYP